MSTGRGVPVLDGPDGREIALAQRRPAEGEPRLFPESPMSSSGSSVDLKALVARSAAGDQSAFAALYDATSAVVFGLALRSLGSRAEAEEVATDVYLQVWKDATRYDASRAS